MKLLNERSVLGFRQEPEKTGHFLAFARECQGLYPPRSQDTMSPHYPFTMEQQMRCQQEKDL